MSMFDCHLHITNLDRTIEEKDVQLERVPLVGEEISLGTGCVVHKVIRTIYSLAFNSYLLFLSEQPIIKVEEPKYEGKTHK